MLSEVYYPVVLNFNPFAFQQFLHEVRMPEVMFSGKHTIPVYDPVSRDTCIVM